MNTLAELHWDAFRRRMVGGFYTTPEFVAMRARNAARLMAEEVRCRRCAHWYAKGSQHSCPPPIVFECEMMQEND